MTLRSMCGGLTVPLGIRHTRNPALDHIAESGFSECGRYELQVCSELI